MQKCCECGESIGAQSIWTNNKGPICKHCWDDVFGERSFHRIGQKAETEADLLRGIIDKMEYNHRCERERMARVIRRLVRYADRVAELHPKAVTGNGQNARVEGGIWLAEFDRQNV